MTMCRRSMTTALFRRPCPKPHRPEPTPEERRRVIEKLREKTFRAFPKTPPPLDVKVEYDYEFWEDGAGDRFSFTSEEGGRLHGYLVSLPTATPRPAPAIVGLRNPGAPMGLFGEDQLLGRESAEP